VFCRKVKGFVRKQWANRLSLPLSEKTPPWSKIMETISVRSRTRVDFIDITSEVRTVVKDSNVGEGVCYVYVPHTTAGVTINENADPSVGEDIKTHLNELIPHHNRFTHSEGNADAHIKSTLVGCSATILVHDNTLLLGTWQGVFFCEFDGPRNRKVHVKVIPQQ
jgi:secondary thiamine-phosphate synthase enzyme